MDSAKSWEGIRLHTIGHSTRSLDELVEMLRAFEISTVVDIRTVPRSRRNPQFGQEVFGPELRKRGIEYVHVPELGGLRRARKDSPNVAWRNASFRGYADYMLENEFEIGLDKLRAVATGTRVAMMCAEAVPWRCHRSLVADAVTVRGAEVQHITGAMRSHPHRLTRFARIEGTRVTYPDDTGERLDTRPPFHLEATVRVLQRRPTNLVDVWDEKARYLRAFETSEGVALVEVTNEGTIDEPDVRFSVLHGDAPSADHPAIGRALRRILGMDVDPEPLLQVAADRREIAPTAAALRGMRPPRFGSLFEAFGNVIPFQQLSLDAGVATVGRVVERLGKAIEYDSRLFHTFPDAGVVADTPVDELRACGLSRRKAEALHRIATAVESGDLSEERLLAMSSTEAARSLTRHPGIGPWSANLVLLRGLGRLDVFPPGDVGAARGLERLTGLEPGPSLDRVVESFGELRGYLYFCSLGGALLERGLIHAALPAS